MPEHHHKDNVHLKHKGVFDPTKKYCRDSIVYVPSDTNPGGSYIYLGSCSIVGIDPRTSPDWHIISENGSNNDIVLAIVPFNYPMTTPHPKNTIKQNPQINFHKKLSLSSGQIPMVATGDQYTFGLGQK